MSKKLLIFLSYLWFIPFTYAEEIMPEYKGLASIVFIEEETAECSISDGKLILIQNIEDAQSYQVWVDRWFMDVQTPDHTKQVLLPKAQATPLGCSIARSGGKQHWTIHSVESINR